MLKDVVVGVVHKDFQVFYFSLWRIADISTVLHLHSHFIVFLSNQQHEMASWCQQGFLMSRDDSFDYERELFDGSRITSRAEARNLSSGVSRCSRSNGNPTHLPG